MKRLQVASAVFAAAVMCGATATAQDKLDLAIVSGIADITQFDGQFAAGVTETLEAFDGAEVSVTHSAPSGGMEDELGMDAILRDMVTIAPDYLLFIVVHWDTVLDRLVALQEAGVNLMVVEYAPDDTGAVKPFAIAVTDHTESGRVTGASAAQHYCADFEGDAIQAALFHGTASSEIGINRMTGIRQAFTEGVEACGKSVEYVNEVFANFNRERAFELAQQVATAHPDLNIIFGANSNTALGIMEGLRTVGVLDQVGCHGHRRAVGGARGDLPARDPHRRGPEPPRAGAECRQGGDRPLPGQGLRRDQLRSADDGQQLRRDLRLLSDGDARQSRVPGQPRRGAVEARELSKARERSPRVP